MLPDLLVIGACSLSSSRCIREEITFPEYACNIGVQQLEADSDTRRRLALLRRNGGRMAYVLFPSPFAVRRLEEAR
jgi:hypothetical protein